MAPSSKSEKDDQKQKQKQQRKQKQHVVKLLNRGKISGHLSQRLFRKLPPRVCVPLKNIVSEEFLRAGHIFLGFTKCGRYVLSYTSDCGEDDDFSFYTYHLYWWEFNLHSRLKQVHHVRLFAGEDIYSELYLTVCEWHNDHSKIVIFGFNTRSSSSALMNMMISDENNRDIYITIASMPPAQPCQQCCPVPTASTIRTGGECLEHGYVLNARYQVVYPFPTFQPALQLKKDQVILLNTSYSLVACAISLCSEGKQQDADGPNNQILYRKRNTQSPSSPHLPSPSSSSSSSFSSAASSSSSSHGSPDRRQTNPQPTPLSPGRSQAAVRAREFAADIFRRAQAAGMEGESERRRENEGKEKTETKDRLRASGEAERRTRERDDDKSSLPGPSSTAGSQSTPLPTEQEDGVACSAVMSPASTSSSSSSPRASSSPEPGYVNYTRLRYRQHQPGSSEPESAEEEDKVQLPFTVSDLKGRNLQLVTGQYSGQCICVEQLTLDFEYLINEVIRNDAEWASQFCSFSDYDVVILEVCPETNIVVINIGLLLLAFSNSEEEHSRPKSYHSSLQVSWDLNTGACCTVGVGDLTEVKGQTSGSVWSSYRKSCVNTVMRWLVPESSSRYINRMTNEAMHKGTSLQVLADSDRGTWIVL